MLIRSKKGSSFLSDNLLGLILSAAILIVLIILLIRLTQPLFDKDDAVATA